jgi:hypothetical protein
MHVAALAVGVLMAAKLQYPHIFISDSLVMAQAGTQMVEAGCESICVLGVDFMAGSGCTWDVCPPFPRNPYALSQVESNNVTNSIRVVCVCVCMDAEGGYTLSEFGVFRLKLEVTCSQKQTRLVSYHHTT